MDLFAPSDEPRWLVIAGADRVARRVHKLPAQVNLRHALREARARMEAEGWSADCDGRYGILRLSRGTERTMVSLSLVPPEDAGYFVGGDS